VTTSGAVREELLRLAKQMPNSPLADATPDEVALVDSKLVSKRDQSRTVSIVDAMRHGAVDRIEQEKSTAFPDDGSQAHNTHSAIFAEVKVDEELGVIRVTRVVSAVAAGVSSTPRPRAARSWAAWCGASAWRCTKRPSSTIVSAAS
jgi:xanthine dehydrogenase YagR molybdenum-binding subunit